MCICTYMYTFASVLYVYKSMSALVRLWQQQDPFPQMYTNIEILLFGFVSFILILFDTLFFLFFSFRLPSPFSFLMYFASFSLQRLISLSASSFRYFLYSFLFIFYVFCRSFYINIFIS